MYFLPTLSLQRVEHSVRQQLQAVVHEDHASGKAHTNGTQLRPEGVKAIEATAVSPSCKFVLTSLPLPH